MLTLNHIGLSYGERTLFQDVSGTIGPHDRICLVGSNGTGKSTLLRILCGQTQPDEGKVLKASYVTAGYLPQDAVVARGRTLIAEVEQAFESVLEVQRELTEAQHALATLDSSSESYVETLEVLGELQHKLEDLDAYRMHAKIERVLMGLGFAVSDFGRTTEEFSGGWQMRIALARLLLLEPSALLLDEPTNHLDLDSLQWLERYLQSYNGAIVLVSHDRAFLEAVCPRTWALHGNTIEEYAGNFSFYERERKVRRELLLNQQKNQEQRIKETRVFIDRFRYKATKARQVQSRIKQLEKMDKVEVEDDEEEIHFRFPPPPSCGKVVLELSGVSKSYGLNTVFRHLDLKIERGDKIAVVGVNGAGKSTLVRILGGGENIDSGNRALGHNATLSYFAQHQADELDPTREVLEVLDEVALGEIRRNLRTLLGAFLFHGDDVFKKVAVLSGGEKSRVALAKMLLSPANVLIMDEPTNHLDMRSKAVLQEALNHFAGTFVIVSHDRAFLDPLVNKVIEVRKDGVSVYLGNVSDYIQKREERLAGAAGSPAKTRNDHSGPSAKAGQRRGQDAERERQHAKKAKPLRKKLEALEERIGKLEREKARLESLMSAPTFYQHHDDAQRTSQEYQVVQQGLESAYWEWNDVTERLEILNKDRLLKESSDRG